MQKEYIMKIFRELTALLLIFALSVGCLASCDNMGGGQNAEEDSYIVNIDVSYATNDPKMKEAIASITENSATLSVLGDDIRVNSKTVMDDRSFNEEYILVGGVLYRSMKLVVGDYSVTSNTLAELTAENRQAVLADIGIGANISTADFKNCQHESFGEVSLYTCADIEENSAKSLEKIFSSGFSGMGGSVSLTGADFSATYNGEKIMDSTLSCHFAVVMNDISYEITMHIAYTYQYTDDITILAPEVIDDYAMVSYEEIIK